ncbi:MAG: arsenic resistance N-acetyltransferase ArsN2 [Bacteroidota bacterium]
MTGFSIGIASPSEKGEIRFLLEKSQLPSEDIGDHLEHFLVAKSDGKVVGAVGLELFGTSALLRSLVVDGTERGKGLGKELYRAVVKHAKDRGVKELGLLTTTAEGFFAKEGFQKAEGEKIPAYIKSTKEYQILCPSSAICMVRRI